MSTKNLARTVIEGGRRPTNKWFRRYSNSKERGRAHRELGQLRLEAEPRELTLPRRKRIRPEFNDKLGPPERWLARQVGRPWSKVRGELFERFDARTTAGRHVLRDHMLRWVGPPVSLFGFCFTNKFDVDRHGILRRARDVHRFASR